MAKQSGLGDNAYIGGYDLSGDVISLSKVSGSVGVLDVTAINKSAHERIYGQRDGEIDFETCFDVAVDAENPVLKNPPTTDTQVMYMRGTVIGNAAACLQAKQVTYEPTRATSGLLTNKIQCFGNSFGLEWGNMLTAGLRTDTAATAGTSFDFGGATSFGFQAYLQVTAFTGTDVTVKLQDSADGVTYADLTSGAFAQTTAAHTFQRIAVGGTATVREFVKVTTVTTGGFTSATFAVVLVKNTSAVVF